MVQLSYAVTIEDLENLPRNMDTDSVRDALDTYMRDAGEQFVRLHPDWFRVGLT